MSFVGKPTITSIVSKKFEQATSQSYQNILALLNNSKSIYIINIGAHLDV